MTMLTGNVPYGETDYLQKQEDGLYRKAQEAYPSGSESGHEKLTRLVEQGTKSRRLPIHVENDRTVNKAYLKWYVYSYETNVSIFLRRWRIADLMDLIYG
jgi:hypothetical protein